MPSDNLSGTDFAELILEAEFHSGFVSFYEYLETMVFFLENESKTQNERISVIYEKIRSGKISSQYDPHQIPPELNDQLFRLQSISEFENILFDSFFVALYFHLESELIRHCRYLEKQYPTGLSLTDIVGNGVQRAIAYLVKVHHLEISLEKNSEWEKIQNDNYLRNCIVHNQGRVDDGFEKSQREKLLKFIQRSNSKLQFSDTWCVLNKDFCLVAIETIEQFLHSVVFAKTKK